MRTNIVIDDRLMDETLRVSSLIATFCLLQGHALLHHDADYDAFERHLGPTVIHP